MQRTGPRHFSDGSLTFPFPTPACPVTRAFSSSLTTTVFSQRSMRRLDASPRRATPGSQQFPIFRTAPRFDRPTTPDDLLAFAAHPSSQETPTKPPATAPTNAAVSPLLPSLLPLDSESFPLDMPKSCD